MRVRVVVMFVVLAIASAGCAVPVPAFSSPYHGTSMWNVPLFGTIQTGTVSICSADGGPVSIDVHVSAPDGNTEITVSLLAGNVHFDGDPDSTIFYVQGAPEHLSLTTVDALEPGECESVNITSSQFFDSDPASVRPFTFTVAW